MEDILNKVEDFSDDEEILGAYDAEWHKMETERVVKLANMEEFQKNQEELEKIRGEIKKSKEELDESKEEFAKSKKELEQQKIELAVNMLKENFDIEFISNITKLNIEEINKLKK